MEIGMTGQTAICNLPAAPVRQEPSHRAEMVNQLLFGEGVEVLEESGEWLRVRSLFDGYEGWVTHHQVEHHAAPPDGSRFVASGLVNPVQAGETIMHVPMGAFLPGLNPEGSLWKTEYRFHGHYRDSGEEPSPELLAQHAAAWLHAPYLWGGKTFMGVDCSGFVQTLFKLQGIHLLRDARQQASQGTEVADFEEARFGDLAFYVNEKGNITHVGMLLGNGEIIHASGKVRIDPVSGAGIVHRESGKKTHQHYSVRRFL
jgi:cell wall-associated NlpC family hydrolase